MWGQVVGVIPVLLGYRIIPTRVGTSYNSVRCNSCHRDHPHACGDKLLRLVTEDHIIGSSPRVWGQVFGVIPVLLVYRIIPTRVGTRVLYKFLCFFLRNHPHACGDKGLAELAELAEEGSSPRVWGQAIHICAELALKRIIPTRVGTRKSPLYF